MLGEGEQLVGFGDDIFIPPQEERGDSSVGLRSGAEACMNPPR